jgi:EAL domain-containing protein (putative c-di-GMP-specific phosphodiesterase class I)
VPHVRAEGNEPILPAAELIRAIDGEFISPRYQPIVRMADRTVTAVEVLARLNHPAYGPVMPDWFVPRFEDTGLAFSLTELITTHAFADQAGPHFRGLGLAVAVNYPLKVLSHPLAAVNLDRKRAALGLTPDQVIVELTESRPVEDFRTLGRSMESLRNMGYRISIDDVGPAVKNFDRLLTLPFTGLKLDKSIVRMLGVLGSGAPSSKPMREA